MIFPDDWAADPKITPNMKAVLLALLWHLNRKTARCDPSIDRLADQTGLSRSTVQRAIRALADYGVISIESGRGRGIRSRYAFPEKGSLLTPNAATENRENRSPGTRKQVTRDSEKVSPVTYEPREENPVEAEPRVAAAYAAADSALLDVPDPPAPPARQPTRSAQTLIAAYVEAWQAARPGLRMDPALRGAIAGQANRLAKTRVTDEDWLAADAACREAGAVGSRDLIHMLADYRPPSRGGPSNVEAYLGLLAEMDEPPLVSYAYPDPPELEGPTDE